MPINTCLHWLRSVTKAKGQGECVQAMSSWSLLELELVLAMFAMLAVLVAT